MRTLVAQHRDVSADGTLAAIPFRGRWCHASATPNLEQPPVPPPQPPVPPPEPPFPPPAPEPRPLPQPVPEWVRPTVVRSDRRRRTEGTRWPSSSCEMSRSGSRRSSARWLRWSQRRCRSMSASCSWVLGPSGSGSVADRVVELRNAHIVSDGPPVVDRVPGLRDGSLFIILRRAPRVCVEALGPRQYSTQHGCGSGADRPAITWGLQ